MTDEKDRAENEDTVRVSDRRAFRSDGSRRPDSGEAEETAPEAPTPEPESEPSAEASDDDPLSPPPASIDFIAFVQSLYFNSLMSLGEIEHPETKRFERNLDLARQNIDILTMLRDKTEGNLTEPERLFLHEVIPQLQLLYVKKAGPTA